MQSGISIIICTYNPDKYIFERVLMAVASCERPLELDIECLIIDNNSSVPLGSEQYITDILKEIEKGRIIIETNQGLTNSRRRGIKEASFSHLLFVDDDNEIDIDYLIQIEKFIKSYPSLAAFNAGVIRVNFVGRVEEWYVSKAKSYYQESNIEETIWGNDASSFSYWPFGTGLVIRKSVGEYYINKLEQGHFTLIDRNGNMLSSGGDGQLVACAIEMGYFVGRAKELCLNHLIAARKATINYLTKVNYGIYYSGELFLKENFPQSLRSISHWEEKKLVVKFFILEACKAVIRNDFKKFSINRSVLLGKLAGNRQALNRKSSWLLRLLSKGYNN